MIASGHTALTARALALLAMPVIAAPAFASIGVDGPARIVVETVDTRGVRVPARLRIEPAFTPDLPRFARPEPTYVLSSGTAELAAYAEPVRIVATRGPSYAPATVVAGPSSRVRLVLAQVVDEGGYVPVDLHVHTEASPDAKVPALERSRALAAEGVRFAIATDHNVVTSLPETRDLATAPGVEVTTWAPEVGHFNVFPATHAPRYQGRAPRELFAEIHRDPSAIVIANHPRLDDHIAYFGLAGLGSHGHGRVRPGFSLDFDALEVWNGYDLARPERVERVFREWLALVAAGRRIAATGARDSHKTTGQWVGYPRTMVRLFDGDALDGAGVARAIRAGRTLVTSGPIVRLSVEGAGPGETARVRPDGMVRVEVEVRAPASMAVDTLDLYFGVTRVRRVPIPVTTEPTVFRTSTTLPVRDARTVVARVSGQGTLRPYVDRPGAFPMAFTSPVRLQRPPSGGS